jgi:type I restriction enzyme S subunit
VSKRKTDAARREAELEKQDDIALTKTVRERAHEPTIQVSFDNPTMKLVPFDLVAKPRSDRGKRIKQRDYLPEGRIPVIDQGQTPIGGYTNDDNFAFVGELPVVLFGDHTRAVKLVDHRFAVGADGIKIFRPAEGVRAKYLYYWMQSARIPDRGYGRHYQYLRQLSVPLPPPSKQDEIVAEIEKQFSRLDEAVANLKRVKANLKRYKAAVLKAAVEGRLVETESELARCEGRSYETGTQLLQRILEAGRGQWQGKGKYKEPAAPDTTDLPELPEGWVWAVSNVIFDFVTSGSRGWAKHYSDSGSVFLRVGNLDHGTIALDLSEIQRVEQPANPEADRSRVRPGDLLISITAELGMVAVAPENLGEAYINQHVAIARSTDLVHKNYIGWYFACEHAGKKQLESLRRGATKAGLGLDDIRSVCIALPPLSEQQRIVTEVDRRLSLLREIEAQVEANLRRAQALRQMLLQSAFSYVRSARQ